MPGSLIIDVSHHNGTINWDAASKQIKGVFIKATEGYNYVDPMFLKNAKGAQVSGVDMGYYHYATLRKRNGVISDAKAEAAWFIKNVKNAPTESLPLVLDIEDPKINISRRETLIFIQTFFQSLTLNGYTDYMLYSGTFFLNDHLPVNHPLGAIRLWIADYNDPVMVPKGWSKIYMRQYSDNGRVNGIITTVDLNKYLT